MPKNNILNRRLLSLDVFRGITIAFMILVNSPGNETAYSQLDHSAWNGLTLTDLVFPFFVFIVGVAVVFSLSRRREEGATDHALFHQIFRRTLIIFAAGLFLNGFPYYHLSTIRILGVLQRIALTYFFASLLFLKTRLRTQILIAIGVLIGYWLIMTQIPVPGYGVGNLSKEGNLAAYVDRLLLHGHLYRPVYDPEGILSTFPAIVTAMLGVFTGCWLRCSRSNREKLYGLLIAVAGGVLGGLEWNYWFPINKALWTSSYVLVTAGLGLFLLALCYWAIEIRGWNRWSKPFEIFGLNAIAAYILHVFFLKVQNLWHMPRLDGNPGNLRLFLTDHLFSPWLSSINASLAYALCYTALWGLVLTFLYRKRLFLKI